MLSIAPEVGFLFDRSVTLHVYLPLIKPRLHSFKHDTCVNNTCALSCDILHLHAMTIICCKYSSLPKPSCQYCSPQGRGGTPCSPCDEHSVIGIVNDRSWEPEDGGRKSLKGEQVFFHSQDLKSRTLGDGRMDA